MHLKIAARKSDLARLQAYAVGRALKEKHPELEIEYLFSISLGDQNQNDPLWRMPEKGVFTADLSQKLMAGECDLVVHSWKDLPTENDSGEHTEIVATLQRADAHDLLLFKRAIEPGKGIKIYSSSPRRAFNLGAFFKWALPLSQDIQSQDIEFCSVRGNITTRIEKLLCDDVHGLVVAKAAIDRLLQAGEPEFRGSQEVIREALRVCNFMVLPLSASPAAPAQGALAIEILRSRADLRSILKDINCEKTMREVQNERREFKAYGGGCHQKIGITSVEKSYGRVDYGRGETLNGDVFSYARLLPAEARAPMRVEAESLFPEKGDNSFFTREPVATSVNFNGRDLWVARAEAWPEGLKRVDHIVWTSGLETWKKLAARGVWVNGSSDSLGEREATAIETILGRELKFLKLTHLGAEKWPSPHPSVGTYRLVANPSAPNLQGKTHFFWLSFTSFVRAIELSPSIIAGRHSCGPGQTYELIYAELERRLPHKTPRLDIYISRESWRKEITAK